MKQLFKKLNEPFLEVTSPFQNVRAYFGVGIFVTLFLYIIQPFSLHTYPKDPFWICLSFGVLTIITAILYDLFGVYVLKLRKDLPSWTLWKWIIDAIFLIIFIGICNYLLINYLIGWQSFSWSLLAYMIFSTLVVGIFPIVFSGMLIQMNAYKRNQIVAADIQTTINLPVKNDAKITLCSQNKKQAIQIAIAELYYLESMQNYVAVYFLKEDKIVKELLRNTIKNMESQLDNTSLFRCHRSFIVNTSLIENVAGNAQGLRLTLQKLPSIEIPVSRKYILPLKNLIAK